MNQHDVLTRLVPTGRPNLWGRAATVGLTAGNAADPGLGGKPDLSGFSGRYRSSRTRANVAIGLLGIIGGVSGNATDAQLLAFEDTFWCAVGQPRLHPNV